MEYLLTNTVEYNNRASARARAWEISFFIPGFLTPVQGGSRGRSSVQISPVRRSQDTRLQKLTAYTRQLRCMTKVLSRYVLHINRGGQGMGKDRFYMACVYQGKARWLLTA